jgi:hypothetical protein
MTCQTKNPGNDSLCGCTMLQTGPLTKQAIKKENKTRDLIKKGQPQKETRDLQKCQPQKTPSDPTHNQAVDDRDVHG